MFSYEGVISVFPFCAMLHHFKNKRNRESCFLEQYLTTIDKKRVIEEPGHWGQEWTWSRQQRSFSEDRLFTHLHPGRVSVGLCIFFCVFFLYLFFCALCLFAHIHPGRLFVYLKNLCIFFCVCFCICFFVHFASSHTSIRVVYLQICVFVNLCFFSVCVFVLFFVHFASHTPLKSCISTTSHSWLWNMHLTLWEIFGWRYMTYI